MTLLVNKAIPSEAKRAASVKFMAKQNQCICWAIQAVKAEEVGISPQKFPLPTALINGFISAPCMAIMQQIKYQENHFHM